MVSPNGELLPDEEWVSDAHGYASDHLGNPIG